MRTYRTYTAIRTIRNGNRHRHQERPIREEEDQHAIYGKTFATARDCCSSNPGNVGCLITLRLPGTTRRSSGVTSFVAAFAIKDSNDCVFEQGAEAAGAIEHACGCCCWIGVRE